MKNERGMALAITVFALVVVTALVAGTFYAATQEQRTGENTRRSVAAMGAAEAGIDDVITNWSSKNNAMAVYPNSTFALASSSSPASTPAGTGTYYGSIYKLGGNLFLVDVTGRDNSSAATASALGVGGRERLGMLLKIQPINFNVPGSLTTRNGVSLSGNATADGTDSPPPGWACPPPGAALAGVATSPGASVTTGGNAQVLGNPPVKADTSISSQFATWDSLFTALASRASIVLPAGNYKTQPSFNGSTCNKTDGTNWGDGVTTDDCSNYYPIIHVTGNITLNGIQGQGILLVDGNISVQGSYQFFGITMAKGSIGSAGGGTTAAHFYGATMAQDVNLSTTNTLSGKATLLYSNCAIQQVINNIAVVSMLKSRSWTQLY